MSAASATTTMVRMAIGFSGGATLSTRAQREEAERMRAALEDGLSWHSVTTADGDVVVALHRVAYLQVDPGDQRLGFG